MKKSSYSKILILAVLFIILAIPTVAYAQESTPTPAPLPPNPTFNSATLISELGTWQFWVVLLVTLVCGALGGLVYELLILQGNIERPHPSNKEEWADTPQYAITKNLYDLGIWARLIIGALAGVAALLVLKPDNTFGLLASAIVAGSAGISVFRSLQDRMLATLSAKETADTKVKLTDQSAKVDEAMQIVAGMKTQAAPGVLGVPEPGVPTDALDKVEKLLLQAKTLGGK